MSDNREVYKLVEKAIAEISGQGERATQDPAMTEPVRSAVAAAIEGCRNQLPDRSMKDLEEAHKQWGQAENPESREEAAKAVLKALKAAKEFLQTDQTAVDRAVEARSVGALAPDPTAGIQEVLSAMGGSFPVRLTKKGTLQDAEAKALAKAQETTSRRPKVPRGLKWNRLNLKPGGEPVEKWEGGQITRKDPKSDIWYLWDPKEGGYRDSTGKLYRWAGGAFVPMPSD